MAPDDPEDMHHVDGAESPSKCEVREGLLSGRKHLRTAGDREWHTFTVRLLLPLEEDKSLFLEDSVSPLSEPETMGDIGHMVTRCRSASASPCFERCRSPQALNEADDKFRDYAKVIARDVARVYTGHEQVDQLRLEMAAVLRGYARKNPHLGYTQGMCFLAAVTCSKGRDSLIAEQLFADYMASFKLLWSQDFPLIDEGIPLLQSVLDKTDGQLSYHLFQTLGLNLTAVLPTAWLSMFGKWLPFEQLLETVPFLASAGLAGFLTVTIVILTSYRSDLLGHQTVEDALMFITALRRMPVPSNLMFSCQLTLPRVRAQVRVLDRPDQL